MVRLVPAVPAVLEVPASPAPAVEAPVDRTRPVSSVGRLVAPSGADRTRPVKTVGPWQRALLVLVGVLLAAVIIAPIALSSQDIIGWAADHRAGLGLNQPWPLVVFIALNAAAAVCVGLVVYCAWKGESPGVFAVLVWAFAGLSALANYRFGSRPGAPADAQWFFPVMSLIGPFLLEVITRRVRRWVQK